MRLRRTASHTTIFPSVVSRFTRASLSTHVTFDRYDARLTDGASLSTSPPARFDAGGDGVINRDELERLLDEFGTARHASATRIIEEDSAETFEAEMFKPLIDYPSVYATPEGVKTAMEMIDGSVVFPVIYDADRTVLSLPPIINGAKSAITLDTRDVFIECTATDLNKAKIVLNTVVAMFSECVLYTGPHTTTLAW